MTAASALASDIDLRTLINEAADTGHRQVIIPAGEYRMAPLPGTAVVVPLRDVQNLDIVATGVTIVCTKRTRAIELLQCQNVTIRGLVIDYDPLPFTQGTVAAVGDDGGWVDVRIHAGYAVAPWSRIDVVDPRTRYRKKGMPFLWDSTAEVRGPDIVRVHHKHLGTTAERGDLVSLSTGQDVGGVCHALTIEQCHGGIVLEDVTIHAAPGMGIVEHGGAGDTNLRRIRIVAGPRPAGATEDRLLTTSWDGIQHSEVRKGPTVEACTIEHCGDDSWSVQSQDYVILARDDTSTIVAPRGSKCPLAVGDTLRPSLGAPAFTIASLEPVGLENAALDPAVIKRLDTAQPWTLWKVNTQALVRATFHESPPWREGDSVSCPERQGNGFVFRGNHTRSSGRILIKAGDGLVEDNLLHMPHGVVVCPELPAGGAAGIRGLVFRNNTIVASGFFCPAPWSPQAGALSIVCGEGQTFRPPGVFDDILIEGNVFKGTSGVNLAISSAMNVVIRGNTFVELDQAVPGDTGAAFGIDQSAVIWLAESDDVTLAGNRVAGPVSKPRPLVRTGRGVTRLTGLDPDGPDGGIAIEAPE
jgi:hypothetical protein